LAARNISVGTPSNGAMIATFENTTRANGREKRAKMTPVNVWDGDLLNRDGQIVSMAHRDDSGNLTVNVSRPPGAPGVSGAGVVCVLTFQATTKGQSDISITRGGAMTSAGKSLQAQPSQATIVVQ